MGLRFIYARGLSIEQMRDHLHKSPLSPCGDAILVWVNEGDFWMLNPTDMELEGVKKAQEDAILAEAEAIKARRAHA